MIGKIVRLSFYKNIHKNITILNLLMPLLLAMVDIIINQVKYFSMKITYYFYKFNVRAHTHYH